MMSAQPIQVVHGPLASCLFLQLLPGLVMHCQHSFPRPYCYVHILQSPFMYRQLLPVISSGAMYSQWLHNDLHGFQMQLLANVLF